MAELDRQFIINNLSSMDEKGRKNYISALTKAGLIPREADGFWGELGHGVKSGVMQTVGGVAKTAHEATGWGAWDRAVQDVIGQNHQWDAPIGYKAASLNPSNIGYTVGQGVGQSAASIAAGAVGTLTGIPGAGIAASTALMFAQTYGERVQEYRRELPDVDEGSIKTAAFFSSLGESFIENLLGPEQISRSLVRSIVTKSLGETIMKKGTKEIMKRIAKEGIKGFMTEGGEEVSQDLWNRFVRSFIDEGVTLPSWEEVREEFMGGAWSGLIMGGPGGAVDYMADSYKQKKLGDTRQPINIKEVATHFPNTMINVDGTEVKPSQYFANPDSALASNARNVNGLQDEMQSENQIPNEEQTETQVSNEQTPSEKTIPPKRLERFGYDPESNKISIPERLNPVKIPSTKNIKQGVAEQRKKIEDIEKAVNRARGIIPVDDIKKAIDRAKGNIPIEDINEAIDKKRTIVDKYGVPLAYVKEDMREKAESAPTEAQRVDTETEQQNNEQPQTQSPQAQAPQAQAPQTQAPAQTAPTLEYHDNDMYDTKEEAEEAKKNLEENGEKGYTYTIQELPEEYGGGFIIDRNKTEEATQQPQDATANAAPEQQAATQEQTPETSKKSNTPDDNEKPYHAKYEKADNGVSPASYDTIEEAEEKKRELEKNKSGDVNYLIDRNKDADGTYLYTVYKIEGNHKIIKINDFYFKKKTDAEKRKKELDLDNENGVTYGIEESEYGYNTYKIIDLSKYDYKAHIGTSEEKNTPAVNQTQNTAKDTSTAPKSPVEDNKDLSKWFTNEEQAKTEKEKLEAETGKKFEVRKLEYNGNTFYHVREVQGEQTPKQEAPKQEQPTAKKNDEDEFEWDVVAHCKTKKEANSTLKQLQENGENGVLNAFSIQKSENGGYDVLKGKRKKKEAQPQQEQKQEQPAPEQPPTEQPTSEQPKTADQIEAERQEDQKALSDIEKNKDKKSDEKKPEELSNINIDNDAKGLVHGDTVSFLDGIAKIMGIKLKIERRDKSDPKKGVYDKERKIAILRITDDAKDNQEEIFFLLGHELYHSIKEQHDNDNANAITQAFDDLIEALRTGTKKKTKNIDGNTWYDEFRRKQETYEKGTNITDEMRADTLGYLLQNPQIWNGVKAALNKKQKGAGTKLFKIIADFIKKVVDLIKGKKLYVSEMEHWYKEGGIAQLKAEAENMLASHAEYVRDNPIREAEELKKIKNEINNEQKLSFTPNERIDVEDVADPKTGEKKKRIVKVKLEVDTSKDEELKDFMDKIEFVRGTNESVVSSDVDLKDYKPIKLRRILNKIGEQTGIYFIKRAVGNGKTQLIGVKPTDSSKKIDDSKFPMLKKLASILDLKIEEHDDLKEGESYYDATKKTIHISTKEPNGGLMVFGALYKEHIEKQYPFLAKEFNDLIKDGFFGNLNNEEEIESGILRSKLKAENALEIVKKVDQESPLIFGKLFMRDGFIEEVYAILETKRPGMGVGFLKSIRNFISSLIKKIKGVFIQKQLYKNFRDYFKGKKGKVQARMLVDYLKRLNELAAKTMANHLEYLEADREWRAKKKPYGFRPYADEVVAQAGADIALAYQHLDKVLNLKLVFDGKRFHNPLEQYKEDLFQAGLIEYHNAYQKGLYRANNKYKFRSYYIMAAYHGMLKYMRDNVWHASNDPFTKRVPLPNENTFDKEDTDFQDRIDLELYLEAMTTDENIGREDLIVAAKNVVKKIEDAFAPLVVEGDKSNVPEEDHSKDIITDGSKIDTNYKEDHSKDIMLDGNSIKASSDISNEKMQDITVDGSKVKTDYNEDHTKDIMLDGSKVEFDYNEDHSQDVAVDGSEVNSGYEETNNKNPLRSKPLLEAAKILVEVMNGALSAKDISQDELAEILSKTNGSKYSKEYIRKSVRKPLLQLFLNELKNVGAIVDSTYQRLLLGMDIIIPEEYQNEIDYRKDSIKKLEERMRAYKAGKVKLSKTDYESLSNSLTNQKKKLHDIINEVRSNQKNLSAGAIVNYLRDKNNEYNTAFKKMEKGDDSLMEKLIADEGFSDAELDFETADLAEKISDNSFRKSGQNRYLYSLETRTRQQNPNQMHDADLIKMYEQELAKNPYIPLDNKTALKLAKARIERYGGPAKVFEMILDNQLDLKTSVGQAIVRELLDGDVYRNADKETRERFEQVTDAYMDSGTVLAQALQARRVGAFDIDDLKIIQQHLQRWERKIAKEKGKDKVNAINKRLKEKYGIDINDLQGKSKEEINDAILAVSAELSTRWDKLYELWINGLLSGPTTHAANMVGNISNFVYEMGVRRLVESAIGSVTGKKGMASFGEFKQMIHAIPWGEAWERAKLSFKLESMNIKGKVENVNAAIPGKTGKLIRVPTRLLRMADEFAKAIVLPMEATAFAYREARAAGFDERETQAYIEQQLKDNKSEANRYGYQRALELTFQEEPGAAVKKLMELRDNTRNKGTGAQIISTLLKYTLPFMKTPTNLLKQGVRKSILGSIGLGLDSIDIARGKKGFDAAFVAKASEQILAWGITMALVCSLGSDDDDDELPLITGAPPQWGSDKQKWMADKIPPYSIRIGNKYFSYKRVEPIVTSLALIADSVEAYKDARDGKGATEALKTIMNSVKQNIVDKSYLQTLGEINDVISDPDKNAWKFATNYASSWMPAVYRQIKQSTIDDVPDNKVRSKHAIHGWGKFLEDNFHVVTNRMGITTAGPKIDYFGREIKKDVIRESPGINLLRLLPTTVIDPDDSMTRADTLLWRYNQSHANNQYYPSVPTYWYTKKGETYYLTGQDYTDYAIESGKLAYKQINNALLHRRLNATNPGEKDIELIKQIFTRARSEVRDRYHNQKRYTRSVE